MDYMENRRGGCDYEACHKNYIAEVGVKLFFQICNYELQVK